MSVEHGYATAFEWCEHFLFSPIDINQWPTIFDNAEESFYKEILLPNEFEAKISKVEYTTGVMPVKPLKYLEYAMYGLTARILSDKQIGFQFGHAVVEYELMSRKLPEIRAMYDKWAISDKTFRCLSGGSTNDTNYGTMQKYAQELKKNGVKIAGFKEPNINNATTAFVFLVDERAWNRVRYPDYQHPNDMGVPYVDPVHFDRWLTGIGGERNQFLRTFLKPFKSA
jgi:hypothetical protein